MRGRCKPFVGSVWLIFYATNTLGYDRTSILTADAAISLSDIPIIVAFGLVRAKRAMFGSPRRQRPTLPIRTARS